MKAIKVFTSILLVTCFAFSSASCAATPDISPKTLADYAEKNGAYQYKNAEEFATDYDHSVVMDTGVLYAFGDVYIHVEEEDVVTAMNNPDHYTLAIGLFYDDKIKEATIYTLGGEDAWGYALALRFGQTALSRWYFERLEEYFDEIGCDTDNSDPSEYLEYFLINGEDHEYGNYLGVYYDYSEDLVFIIQIDGNDKDAKKLIDDVCEDLNLVSPTTI